MESKQQNRIFLSYSRKDDEPFVKRLYNDLTGQGFDIWWDRVDMPSRGLKFTKEIQEAINERDRLLLVLGPYACTKSDYVPYEWKHALQYGKVVNPILRCGDLSILPNDLKTINVDIEDFRDDSVYKQSINKLIRQLSEPIAPMGKLIGVRSLPPHLLERKERLESLKDTVLADLQRPVVLTGADAKIGVQGMGGIGKSVLTNMLTRDEEVRRHFPDGIVWIQIGTNPDIAELQRNVLKDLGEDSGHVDNITQGKNKIQNLLHSKSVLLVLDDVWEREHADAFDVLGPRCKAIITTRDAGLITSLGGTNYQVQMLSETESLELLAKAANNPLNNLPHEAKEIVAECGRLPLAVALCGGMARKGNKWKIILERLKKSKLDKIGDRHGEFEQHRTILAAMEVSLDALDDPEDRKRFIELAVFQPDEAVPEAAVTTLWTYTGNLDESDCEDLLISLSERSLIRLDVDTPQADQDPVRKISLHDLLHDFATRLADNLLELHNNLLESYHKLCSNKWPNGPDDGYFFQKLCYHLALAERWEELQDILLKFDYPLLKCKAGLLNSLIDDYNSSVNYNLSNNTSIITWRDFFITHSHILRRGSVLWPSYKILLQLAMEHADESPVTQAAESWLAEDKCDWTWIRNIKRPEKIEFNPCQLILEGHTHNIEEAIELSSGHIVSWADDRTCRVWDSINGENILTLEDFGTVSSGYMGVPFPRPGVIELHDSRILVWANKKDLRLINLSTTQTEMCFKHQDVVRGALMISDDHFLSWSEDRTARIWNLQTGEELQCLKHVGWVFGAMLLSNKNILTWSGEYSLHIWAPDTGNKLATLEGHSADIDGVIELQNQYLLSWSAKDSFMIWAPDGEKIPHSTWPDETFLSSKQTHILMPDGTYQPFIYTSDGCLFATHFEYGIRLWNEKQPLSFPPVEAQGVLKLSDSTVLMWDYKHLYKIFPDTSTMIRIMIPPFMTNDSFGSITLLELHGGNLCSWKDKTIWVSINRHTLQLEGHTENIHGVLQLSSRHNYNLLSWSSDGTLRVWDINTGESLHVLNGHSGKVMGVRELSDGRLLSRSWLWAGTRSYGSYEKDDTTIRVWQIPDKNVTSEPASSEYRILNKFLPIREGNLLAYGSNRLNDEAHDTIWIIDSASGEIIQTVKEEIGHLSKALPLQNDKIATFGEDNILRIWESQIIDNIPTLIQIRQFEVADNNETMAITSNNKIIRCGNDMTLQLWDAEQGLQQSIPLDAKLEYCECLEGARCLYITENSPILSVWDLETGNVINLKGHTEAITGVKLLKNGHLISWAADSTLRLWNIETGNNLSTHKAVGANYIKNRNENEVVELVNGWILLTNPHSSSYLWDHENNEIYSLAKSLFAKKAIELGNGKIALIPSYTALENVIQIVKPQAFKLGQIPNYKDSENIIRVIESPSLLLKGHTTRIRDSMELSTEHLLSWSDNGHFCVWNSETGTLIDQFTIRRQPNSSEPLYIRKAFSELAMSQCIMGKQMAFTGFRDGIQSSVIWHSDYDIWQATPHLNGGVVVSSYKGLKYLKVYSGKQPCSFTAFC